MPPVVRQSPLLSEPCLMLAVYTLVSGAGVYSQLTASKEGQEAAGEAAKMLHLATRCVADFARSREAWACRTTLNAPVVPPCPAAMM